MEVDLLDFLVPVENNKTLFVWNIRQEFTEAQVHEHLSTLFSAFGPLYLVKVNPNAPFYPPGFNGMIKFYSEKHACKAQRNTDGRSLFQDTPLKVKLSTKKTPHFLSGSRPLNHGRCVDLANHCLGFNGWTSDIIDLKELPTEEEEDEEEAGVSGRVRVRLGCVVQISFPRHGVITRGAASVDHVYMSTGPESMIQKRSFLHKLVRDKAAVQAFSTVVLVLLGEGKVMVELRRSPEHLFSEEPQGIVRVCEDQAQALVEEEDLWQDEDLDLSVW
ncbi:RAD52 motif-containing protein 1 [Stigmatopora argus]